MFSTRFTTARDFRTDWYAKWKDRLGFGDELHRKCWEVAMVAETLAANGVLANGKRGVGFGVGGESLTGVLAQLGPSILATDLCRAEWASANHAFRTLANLNRVQTRVVDMNWIDGGSGVGHVEEELYDFSYSVCSMDHCGTAWYTKRFLLNQMNCIRFGGMAVHTAEYTISLGLPKTGVTVWLDWKDIIDLQELLSKLGHEMAPVDWNIGDSIEDHQIDPHPYPGPVHLKPEVNAGRWCTCVVFAVRKTRAGVFWVPLDEAEARGSIDLYQRSHSQM